MIWLTWRQFRLPAVLAAAALGAIAIVLGVTNTHHATGGYLSHAHLLEFLSTGLVAVPALIGAFWGAPLLARELETGTWRLVWTQSVTRTRWLAVKVALIGVASVTVTGLLTLMLTRWSSAAANMRRFSPAMFAERGIAPMGYAAFAFVLGLTAGILIRRTLPAMATTLVAFLAVRIVVANWIRPHFAVPLRISRALASLGNGPGLQAKPGDWVASDNTLNAAGRVVNDVSCGVRVSAGSAAPLSQAAVNPVRASAQACLAGYREVLTYQPANRYWTFQAYETAIFAALALILAGFCFWWIRHRLS